MTVSGAKIEILAVEGALVAIKPTNESIESISPIRATIWRRLISPLPILQEPAM